MQDAFSPQMVTVYLALIAAAGTVFRFFADIVDKRQRRAWEIEDRLYKQQLAEKAEAAKIAAVTSAHVASNASRELGEKIDSSKAERKQQIEGLMQSVQENTALTQESKDASREALEVANGHNAKILQATELARQALSRGAE